jgi:hypothetical protein
MGEWCLERPDFRNTERGHNTARVTQLREPFIHPKDRETTLRARAPADSLVLTHITHTKDSSIAERKFLQCPGTSSGHEKTHELLSSHGTAQTIGAKFCIMFALENDDNHREDTAAVLDRWLPPGSTSGARS